ncbi:MAG TPA: threonine/serine exporter family protein, partial [Gemmataceae bacterium]
MSNRCPQAELLACAGRLLLENGASTSEIHRVLAVTSQKVIGDHCVVEVAYGGVSVLVNGQAAVLQPVREYRHNIALQLRVHSALQRVCRGELESASALAELQQGEAGTAQHNRWLTIVLLGIAAASLAGLLGADAGAVLVKRSATRRKRSSSWLRSWLALSWAPGWYLPSQASASSPGLYRNLCTIQSKRPALFQASVEVFMPVASPIGRSSPLGATVVDGGVN